MKSYSYTQNIGVDKLLSFISYYLQMEGIIKARLLRIVFDNTISMEKKAKKMQKIYEKMSKLEQPEYMDIRPGSLQKYISLIRSAQWQALGSMDQFLSVNVFDRDIDSFMRIIKFQQEKQLVDKYI